MSRFYKYLQESPASDAFEFKVADAINTFPGYKAERPYVNQEYPDIILEYNGKKAWVEVKMDKTAQFGNAYFQYASGTWRYNGKLVHLAGSLLNILKTNSQSVQFIKELKDFVGRENIGLGSKKDPNWVPTETLADFLKTNKRTQDFINIKGVALTEYFQAAYKSKKAIAEYAQIKDNFV